MKSRQLKILTSELVVSDGRDFERKALPLLRVALGSVVAAPALGSYDRMGADHLVWEGTGDFTVVVQCKGFVVAEQELGKSQVKQCVESIASFRKSGRKAQRYVLAINRMGRNKDFRDSVKTELDRLVADGIAGEAKLWGCRTLVNHAARRMAALVRTKLVEAARRSASEGGEYLGAYTPLDVVPYRVRELLIDRRRLTSEGNPVERLGDPAAEIGSSLPRSSRVLLIGEAGFGKTTVASRLAAGIAHVVYTHASNLPEVVNNATELLANIIPIDSLLGDFEPEDMPTLRRLIKPAYTAIFNDPRSPITLVIDALDESPMLSKRAGLQRLFNSLRSFDLPILMVARSEFWDARVADFTTAYWTPAVRADRVPSHEHVEMVELLPWGDEQIASLARRFRDALRSQAERGRLERFIEMVAGGNYQQFYGDIPRRPLFLRMILDTVAGEDIHRVGRSQLFSEWVRLKIERDVVRPTDWPAGYRLPIVSDAEGVDATIDLAVTAMEWAAYLMTREEAGTVVLVPDCEAKAVLRCDPRLERVIDPTGLVLNSLLVPASQRSDPRGFRLRFAHRAFQEYFLARFLSRTPSDMSGLTLPESVVEWVREMQVG